MRYPALFVDEAWLASRAWAFITTGHQYGSLDAGVLGQIYPGIWTVNQWSFTALQSLVLRLFPEPLLLPLRLLSLAEGFGLLVVNYWICQKLGDKQSAFLSVVLLAISNIFWLVAHMARYESLAVLLGYLALALLINLPKGKFFSGFLAGLSAGLAVETHLNALIFFPALVFIVLHRYIGKFLHQADSWGLVVGSMGGCVYFLALHIFPYPQTFFQVGTFLFGQTHLPPFLSSDLSKISAGFVEVGRLLLLGCGALTVLSLAAIPILIHRKTSGANTMLLINLVLAGGAALIFPHKLIEYAIYLAPAFLWLAGVFVAEAFRNPWRGGWADYAGRVLVIGVVVATILFDVQLLAPDRYADYRQAQQKIDALVAPGDTIMGSQVYWLGLYDHAYTSWEQLIYYMRFYPDKTLGDAIQYYHPDIFIVEQWYEYRLPLAELRSYLDEDGVLVSTSQEITYLGSPVEIYRLSWTP